MLHSGCLQRADFRFLGESSETWNKEESCLSGGIVGWDTALQVGRSQVRIMMVSLEFFFDIIPPAAPRSLASNRPLTDVDTRNISLVGKGGRCVGLTTLPPSCADCLEIWEPQTTETLQACNRLVQGLLYLFFLNLQHFLINSISCTGFPLVFRCRLFFCSSSFTFVVGNTT